MYASTMFWLVVLSITGCGGLKGLVLPVCSGMLIPVRTARKEITDFFSILAYYLFCHY